MSLYGRRARLQLGKPGTTGKEFLCGGPGEFRLTFDAKMSATRARETISAIAAWLWTLGRALATMAEGAIVSAAVLLPLVAWAVAR